MAASPAGPSYSLGFWADWTFCPTRYFGRRGYDRYWDTGRNLARTRRFAVPRGIVTTDTRGLTRDRWGKPNEVFRTLARDTRTLTMRKGANRLQFAWSGTLIDPTSLELLPLAKARKISVKT